MREHVITVIALTASTLVTLHQIRKPKNRIRKLGDLLMLRVFQLDALRRTVSFISHCWSRPAPQRAVGDLVWIM